MAYIHDYTIYDDCDDPPTDWASSGDMPVKTNQDGSVPQFYIQGTGCVETQLGAEKQGYITHTETVNLTNKALVIYNWVTGPGELAVLDYWTNRVYQDANYVDYDLLPELLTLATGGWLPYVLWPTPDATQAHITNSGTPTVSAITDVEVRGYNIGTTINIKVMGFDIVGSIGYLGANAQTVTIDQLAQESADNYYGVITVKGGTIKTFQVQCMIRYGGSGTTTVNESNKTITFRGANPDHPVGYLFNSGGTATNITWTDMVFNWEFPQDAFTFTGTPDIFKIAGSSFNLAGDIELPAYSTNRWIKTSKFNDCGEIDIGDCTFEDNTIANATSGVLYSGTGTYRSKNNTYIDNTHAIHFDTVGSYTIDGDQFSGNTYDVLNSDDASTITAGSFIVDRGYKILTVGTTNFTLIGAADNNIGTKFVATGVGSGTGTATEVLVINKSNGTNISTAENTGTNSDTLFVASITMTITVQDTDTDPIENVQTSIHKLSDRSELMNEDTNASGIASEVYSGSIPVDVEIRCRKASAGATKYVNFSTLATLSTDFNLLVTMREDPNNNATT